MIGHVSSSGCPSAADLLAQRAERIEIHHGGAAALEPGAHDRLLLQRGRRRRDDAAIQV